MNKWIAAGFGLLFMVLAISITHERTHSLIFAVSAAAMAGISKILAELEEIKTKQK